MTSASALPRRWVPYGVFAAVAALAIVFVILKGRSASERQDGAGSQVHRGGAADAGVIGDAGVDAMVAAGSGGAPDPATGAASPNALLVAVHAALMSGDPGALAPLMSPSVFGFGLEARDRASGRDAVALMLRRALGSSKAGFRVSSTFSHVGLEGPSAWIAEEVTITSTETGAAPVRLMVTFAALQIAGRWEIRAMHWAVPITNAVSLLRLREDRLSQPAPIEDDIEDKSIEAAFRESVSSTQAFVKSISARDDVFNFGSAPGERTTGGQSSKRVFAQMQAKIWINDGVKVAAMSEGVGWAAANVAFSFTTDGTVLTFVHRVLAVLVRETGTWRVVQTHWSHGS